MSVEHEEHVIARLARVTPICSRRMFGGLELYVGDLFFAQIGNNRLYLKVNHRNRTDFKKLGAIEFQPNPGKPQTESLYALPFRILDDTWRLRTWIRKSLNAARAAD